MSRTADVTENTALEEALKSLAPLAGGFNRDRLMFQAGQVSVPRHGWIWPTLTSALALGCVGLALHVALQSPQVVERIVYVETPAPSEQSPPESQPSRTGDRLVFAAPPQDPLGYAQLRTTVLRDGIEALPRPARDATPQRLNQRDRVMNMRSDRDLTTLLSLQDDVVPAESRAHHP